VGLITFDFKIPSFEFVDPQHQQYVRPVNIENHNEKHEGNFHEVRNIQQGSG